VFANSRAEFVADVKRSKFFLEQTIGKPVRGYRAPDFSIVRGTLWALEELAAQGFEYDSSVFPVTRPRYGIAEWPLEPARVRLASGQSILEFPIGTYRVLGRNWPVGGGGYNRLLPGFATRWFAKSVMRSRPFVFYCHPYEFDPREFDDMEIATVVSPALTTVRLPIAEIGIRAAGYLIARLRGEDPPARMALPIELVARASTAAPRAPKA